MGGGELLSLHLLAHQGKQRSAEVEAVGLEDLFKLFIRPIIPKDRPEHVIGAHVHSLRLHPLGGAAIERAVAQQG